MLDINKYTPVNIIKGNLEEIQIIPNPAQDYIEISKPSEGFKPSDGYSVHVFDILGMELTTPSDLTPGPSPSGEVNKVRIDITQLPPGFYFVRVGDVVGKFVKL